MNLKQQLIGFEGCESCAYPDPLTGGAPWTIGVGHTGPEVHPGLEWSAGKIDSALDADIAGAEIDCRASFPWFDDLNEPRQAVLVGMVFQMGVKRVRQFAHALAAMKSGDYAHAAQEMMDSAWARQTLTRATRLAEQMRLGEWA